MAEAYCVKDKKKVEVQNAQRITMKNGKPAIQGTCPECGGTVCRPAGGGSRATGRALAGWANANNGLHRLPVGASLVPVTTGATYADRHRILPIRG